MLNREFLRAQPYTQTFQRHADLVDESIGLKQFQTRAALLDARVVVSKNPFLKPGATAER